MLRMSSTKGYSLLAGLTVLAAFSAASVVSGAESEWRVGLARVKITPGGPIAMCGYGNAVSTGVLDDLYAKAMVIEDLSGQRGVLLTADLLFFRAPFAEALCKQISAKTGLERRQILLNGSHTHAGPVFGIKDPDRANLTPEQRKAVDDYTAKLRSRLVDVVDHALADMEPATIAWGIGRAGSFVMNRRRLDDRGKCKGMGPNPDGPVDRDVPVFRIDWPCGRMRAVVFGCACHAVTLDGANRKISGDYPSFAQQYVETQHPDVQAMFVVGCAADANTHPRGGPNQVQFVRQHGESLGREVCRVLDSPLEPVSGPLRAELRWTDLPLETTYTREQLEHIAATGLFWHVRNARAMLEMLDRNEPLPAHYRAPIALWQFSDDLTLVGLPGEPVVEYVGMLRQALGPERLWIAGFANESFGYLPTAKILAQGGHETIGLTLDIGLFSPSVEDVVVNTVRQLARKAGRPLP